MAKIENLDRVITQMRRKAAAKMHDLDVSVAIGYTANYALYIHENQEIHPPGMLLKGQPRPGSKTFTVQSGKNVGKMSNRTGYYWDPQGRAQPKFLEGPFRTNRKKYGTIVMNALRKGMTMAQALLMAGLELQRDSMLLVPVDTGNLKASAFTRLEQPAVRS